MVEAFEVVILRGEKSSDKAVVRETRCTDGPAVYTCYLGKTIKSCPIYCPNIPVWLTNDIVILALICI